jgi:hypothetical protein
MKASNSPKRDCNLNWFTNKRDCIRNTNVNAREVEEYTRACGIDTKTYNTRNTRCEQLVLLKTGNVNATTPKRQSPIQISRKTKPKPKPKNVKECDICGEENVRIKDFIKCPHCNFEACKSCTEMFLLGITNAKPKCMNSMCKKLWPKEFLLKHFDQKFMDKLNLLEAKYIITKEKPLLPHIQNIVKDKKEIAKIDDELKKIKRELVKIYDNGNGDYKTNKKYKELDTAYKKLADEKRLLRERIRSNNYEQTIMNKVINCPNEKCKGYIEEDYRCGICRTQVCDKCLEILTSSHECDKNVLENLKCIVADTKPCPNCGVAITKTEGCDQMYCIKCNTAFSWDTGGIEIGVIHNPLFYEYQKRLNQGVAPRVMGELRCGGLPTQLSLVLENDEQITIIRNFYSLIKYINEELLQEDYIDVSVGREPNFRDLRIKYLAEDLTEQQWEEEIIKIQLAFEMRREESYVLQMASSALTDLFILYSHNHISNPDIPRIETKKRSLNLLYELLEIEKIVNEAFATISKQYKVKTPRIKKGMFTFVFKTGRRQSVFYSDFYSAFYSAI